MKIKAKFNKKSFMQKKEPNPFDEIVERIAKLEAKLWKRCLLEGCRYGYPIMNEKPTKECIYCGQEREETFNSIPMSEMENFYESWGDKIMLDIIFRGTEHSPKIQKEFVDNLKKDLKKGKFK